MQQFSLGRRLAPNIYTREEKCATQRFDFQGARKPFVMRFSGRGGGEGGGGRGGGAIL